MNTEIELPFTPNNNTLPTKRNQIQPFQPIFQPLNTEETSQSLFDQRMDSPGQLEDGRVINFLFRRLMIIEQACLFYALLGLILSVLYYDSDFAVSSNRSAMVMLWLMFIANLLLMGLTVLRYVVKLDLLKQQYIVDQGTQVYQQPYLKSIIIELGLMLLQPYPFLNEVTFQVMDFYEGHWAEFKVNHFFCILILVRLYIILRVMFRSTKYMAPRAIRIGRMYGCETGYQYCVKCLFKDYPLQSISLMFFFQVFYFAWALRISERPLTKMNSEKGGTDAIDMAIYLNCMWTVMNTMTTVGYGDYFPRSLIGRILASFIAIWGIYTVSMLVVVLQMTFNLDSIEQRALNVLNCLINKEDQKARAAFILTIVARMQKGKTWGKVAAKHQQTHSDKHEERLRQHSQSFLAITRTLRELHGKDNVQDQMSRMFQQVRDDILSLNINQKRMKLFIENYFENTLNDNLKQTYVKQ